MNVNKVLYLISFIVQDIPLIEVHILTGGGEHQNNSELPKNHDHMLVGGTVHEGAGGKTLDVLIRVVVAIGAACNIM